MDPTQFSLRQLQAMADSEGRRADRLELVATVVSALTMLATLGMLVAFVAIAVVR